MSDWRDSIREAVLAAGSTSLPDLVGELERGKAIAIRRMQAPTAARLEVWSAESVGERFDVSTKWVYANAKQLGATRLSAGVLRFDPKAVEAFMRSRRE